MKRVRPFLWFDEDAEEAARFYVSIFKNSRIIEAGEMVVTFELDGQEVMALNGGPHFRLNEAFSFFVSCETQAEVDYYWERLLEGGEESRCGWLKDKFGLSWQIVPDVLGELMGDPDPAKSKRVFDAMMKMRKLEIDALREAYEGRAT